MCAEWEKRGRADEKLRCGFTAGFVLPLSAPTQGLLEASRLSTLPSVIVQVHFAIKKSRESVQHSIHYYTKYISCQLDFSYLASYLPTYLPVYPQLLTNRYVPNDTLINAH